MVLIATPIAGKVKIMKISAIEYGLGAAMIAIVAVAFVTAEAATPPPERFNYQACDWIVPSLSVDVDELNQFREITLTPEGRYCIRT